MYHPPRILATKDPEVQYRALSRRGRRLVTFYTAIYVFFLLVGCVGAAVVAVYSIQREVRWNGWDPTQGSLASVRRISKDCYAYIFTFTYRGQTLSGEGCGPGPRPRLGTPVQVRVNPQQPAEYLSSIDCNSSIAWAMIPAGLMAAFGVLGLVMMRRLRQLVRGGAEVQLAPVKPDSPRLCYAFEGTTYNKQLMIFPPWKALARQDATIALIDPRRPRRGMRIGKALISIHADVPANGPTEQISKSP